MVVAVVVVGGDVTVTVAWHMGEDVVTSSTRAIVNVVRREEGEELAVVLMRTSGCCD